jgi:hypothetical protein
MPGELTVRDHTGTRRTLERCEVHDSNDQPTLGVQLTMSGDLWDQIHYLGDQAKFFVNQLMPIAYGVGKEVETSGRLVYRN